jgi:hypothetical protein
MRGQIPPLKWKLMPRICLSLIAVVSMPTQARATHSLGQAFLGKYFRCRDEITGIRTSAGGVLMVTAKNRTLALYGSGSKDWQQKVVSESVGVQDGTLQPTFVPVGLSDRGLVRLDRVQELATLPLTCSTQRRRSSPLSSVSTGMHPLRWLPPISIDCSLLLAGISPSRLMLMVVSKRQSSLTDLQ